MSDGKIICAVDFGTTYSGVAFAYVENGMTPDEVEVTLVDTQWPKQGGQSSPKVPTLFKFDKTAPNGFKFGFEVDEDPDAIFYAKLYLDPDQIQVAQTLATFSTRPQKLPPNRKVTDGIGRFLAEIRNRALDRMRADWGEDFVESTSVEYWLTVPAVWSDKAKSDTLLCASSAGFGDVDKIRLITEPEAAAVHTFHELPDSFLKKGDIFITVDAGGGTVDLTSYKIATKDPVLRVNEVTVGGGGLCGSVYLNRRFEELVKTKIGKQLNNLSKTESVDALQEIQKVFNEDIKPDFGVEDDAEKDYQVPLPDSFENDPVNGVEDGILTITAQELQSVFDEVINQILSLIVDQVDQIETANAGEVSAILLVGGFGSSEYLRRKVEEHFADILDVKVLQPANAWSAVVRGAMLRALQGDIVESRIIRSHYGIIFKSVWNPAVHEAPERKRAAAKYKVWDENERLYKCENQMRWYAKKGDEFSNEKLVAFSFYRNLTTLSNMIFSTDLIINSSKGEVPFFHDSDCKTLAVLKSDLSHIPKDQFELVQGEKGEYYKVEYEIAMHFEAAISFRLVFNGKVVGEVSADYTGGGKKYSIKG